MKKSIDFKNEDLYFIGTNGQYRFIKKLLSDKGFFMEAMPSLKATYFTDTALKKMVKEILKRWEETGDTTNFTDLEFMIKGCNEEEIPLLKAAYMKLKEEMDGQDIAAEKCMEFLKRQNALNTLSNGIESLKNSGYSVERMGRIIDQLQDVERCSATKDTSVADVLDDILNESPKVKVPTGIKELDEKMRGGLTKGCLGLLIAGTGVGKTTLASIMCCNAALMGYKVLHIFFEDPKTDIGKKYYAHLTGRYTYEFNNEADKEALKEEIWNSHPRAKEALKMNVRLLRMPNGTTSVDDVIGTVNRLITVQNWNPDMIFIDYIGCMETTSNEMLKMQNECQAYERMTKRLESFASDYNIAVWIAQQTNRNGMIATTANQRMGNIQGSFRVTQPCSAILYLDRSQNNIDGRNYANLYLDKCRGGEPTEWENIYLNNGTCKIDLSDTIRNDEDLEYDMNDEYNNQYNNNNNNNNNNRYGNFKGYTGVF